MINSDTHCTWGDCLRPENADYIDYFTHVSTIIHVDAFRFGGPGIDTPVEHFGFAPTSSWTVRKQLIRARDTGKVSILVLGIYYGNGLAQPEPNATASLIGFGPYQDSITEGGIRSAIDAAVKLDIDVLQLFNEHDFPDSLENQFVEWVKYAASRCKSRGIRLLVESRDFDELEKAAPYANIIGQHLFGRRGQWRQRLDEGAALARRYGIPLWLSEMIPLGTMEGYVKYLETVERITKTLNGRPFVSAFLGKNDKLYFPRPDRTRWDGNWFIPAYQILYATGVTPGGKVFLDRYTTEQTKPIRSIPDEARRQYEIAAIKINEKILTGNFSDATMDNVITHCRKGRRIIKTS